MALSKSQAMFVFFTCLTALSTAQVPYIIGSPMNHSELIETIDKLIPIVNRGYDKYGNFVPNRKAWSLPLIKDGTSTNSWLVHATYDWLMISTSPQLFDIVGNYNSNIADYDPAIVIDKGQSNFITLRPNSSFAGIIPIPPNKETGFKDWDSWCSYVGCWDSTRSWLSHAFRARDTSMPKDTSSDYLIGFAHNEDHWQSNNGETVEYKSVGVIYSNDNGKSWTRSVPILTRGEEADGGTGCGDMAVMWNHKRSEWHAFVQEYFNDGDQNGLVMAVSNDTLARPGTWYRVQPTNGTEQTWKRDSGYALGPPEAGLPHPSLVMHHHRGTNPSIIWDDSTQKWHMVFARWGGGIRYSNSDDGYHWTTPLDFPKMFHGTSSSHPTLIGSRGDTSTANGIATMYYHNHTGEGDGHWYRAMWSVGLRLDALSQLTNVTSTAGTSDISQKVLMQPEL